ncbi:MAG: TRAP transporter small permease [OCS116 cluster bacterium]|uniref:TRAP transporter small permease protein n=1 Tax=OCS116 cluster bacterium TaxID=2030921 RepID=A0A2A4Z1W0_9PROT|nr:TRAP transporter small permease [OCS116 cluster bacterium]
MDTDTHKPVKRLPKIQILFEIFVARMAMYIGGCLLAFLTIIIVFNVLIMRKLINAPIQGAEDTFILALIALVAISIPYGGRVGAHIEIEIVTEMMGQKATRLSLILTRVIGAIFVIMMSWRLWISGAKAVKFGEVTQQLEISYEYFYYGLSICFGLFAIGQLFDIYHLIKNKKIPEIYEN